MFLFYFYFNLDINPLNKYNYIFISIILEYLIKIEYLFFVQKLFQR